MLSLDKLVFDPSNPGDGASLGAYLRASDGTLLTHTDVGGKKALDVRLAEGVNVEVDLNFADDSVTAHQGGSWEVSLDSATLAALENITVSAIDLDIRNLVFANDKVDVSGSTVNVTPAGLTSAAYGAQSVTSTATKIIATNLASRKKVIVQNLGSKDMFFGHNNSVTISNGLKIAAGASGEFELGPSLDLYGITASGTADVRYFEVA